MEVIRQIVPRFDDPFASFDLFGWPGFESFEKRLSIASPERVVDLFESSLLLVAGNNDDLPGLHVPACRCPAGRLKNTFEYVVGDRIGLQSANGSQRAHRIM